MLTSILSYATDDSYFPLLQPYTNALPPTLLVRIWSTLLTSLLLSTLLTIAVLLIHTLFDFLFLFFMYVLFPFIFLYLFLMFHSGAILCRVCGSSTQYIATDATGAHTLQRCYGCFVLHTVDVTTDLASVVDATDDSCVSLVATVHHTSRLLSTLLTIAVFVWLQEQYTIHCHRRYRCRECEHVG